MVGQWLLLLMPKGRWWATCSAKFMLVFRPCHWMFRLIDSSRRDEVGGDVSRGKKLSAVTMSSSKLSHRNLSCLFIDWCRGRLWCIRVHGLGACLEMIGTMSVCLQWSQSRWVVVPWVTMKPLICSVCNKLIFSMTWSSSLCHCDHVFPRLNGRQISP